MKNDTFSKRRSKQVLHDTKSKKLPLIDTAMKAQQETVISQY
jgi:hypothetical protein